MEKYLGVTKLKNITENPFLFQINYDSKKIEGEIRRLAEISNKKRGKDYRYFVFSQDLDIIEEVDKETTYNRAKEIVLNAARKNIRNKPSKIEEIN